MAGGPLIACEHCATLHERIPVEAGATAACTRCGYVLYRQSGVSIEGWIALTLGALFVFAIANYFPIATLRIGGMSVEASLPGALYLTWIQGHEVLAIMTGLFAFWLPLTQLLVLLWSLLAIRRARLPGDFAYGMRLYHLVLSWSMVPVLMLGILVAIVKFSGMAIVVLGPGIWAIGLLSAMLTALGRVSAHRLWRYAEDRGLVETAPADMANEDQLASCSACGLVQTIEPASEPCACSRCGATIHFRKPDTAPRVWALVIAAAIVYIPANVLPVMQVRTAMGNTDHTILGGVVELWRLGSWDLAVIVFVASVVVPLTKLLALTVLMLRRRWEGRRIQRQRTRLYELIEFIGQWSMLDVFVVILMSAMANFPGISQVIAGPGAASFGIVVILTMLATMSYDPREGWDQERGVSAERIQSSAPGGPQRDGVSQSAV
jgi:paraquat-inducible protein A